MSFAECIGFDTPPPHTLKKTLFQTWNIVLLGNTQMNTDNNNSESCDNTSKWQVTDPSRLQHSDGYNFEEHWPSTEPFGEPYWTTLANNHWSKIPNRLPHSVLSHLPPTTTNLYSVIDVKYSNCQCRTLYNIKRNSRLI